MSDTNTYSYIFTDAYHEDLTKFLKKLFDNLSIRKCIWSKDNASEDYNNIEYYDLSHVCAYRSYYSPFSYSIPVDMPKYITGVDFARTS